MKTTKKQKVLSVKGHGIISAIAMILLIIGQIINHHPLCPIVLLAGLVLSFIPLLMKRAVHDELARENEAKAMRITLFTAYAVLLVLSMVAGNGIEIPRQWFLIALSGLLCLQGLSLAYFESRGVSSSDDEEE